MFIRLTCRGRLIGYSVSVRPDGWVSGAAGCPRGCQIGPDFPPNLAEWAARGCQKKSGPTLAVPRSDAQMMEDAWRMGRDAPSMGNVLNPVPFSLLN